MKASIQFKGISGPHHTGGLCCYGYVVSTSDGDIFKGSGMIGRATENSAEYIACIEAMKKALDIGVKDIFIYGDNSVVMNQLKHSWGTHTKLLENLHKVADELLCRFDSSRILLVDGGRIREALRLARAAYQDVVSLTDVKRIDRAREIVASGLVTRISEHKFKVKTYDVDLKEKTCNCGDNLAGHHKCKHMIAAEIFKTLNGELDFIVEIPAADIQV
jgi:ribonuclease HI